MDTLKVINKTIIDAGIVIQEYTEGEIVAYTFYKNNNLLGNIELSRSTEMIEQLNDEEIPVIRLRNIYVEDVFRGKGYSKLLIAYGIYMFREKYPDIQFSALDDDSDAATTPYKNLYWKFGYVPKDTYTKKIKKYKLARYAKQEQPEMILDFDSVIMKEFINNLILYGIRSKSS